jgi:hypothetical protein
MITAPALTAARVTRLAKAAAPELRWSSEKGARGILVRVWDAPDDGTDRAELRLLNEARRLINATDLSATVVALRASRRTGRTQFRILVTSEAQESAAIQEQADKRAAALAAAAEVKAAQDARKGPSPEAVATAVAQLQAELTAAAPAIGRIMDEPLPGEESSELSEQAQRTIAERQAARGDLITAPREDSGYPPYTTAEAREAAAEGLHLFSTHGGSYQHEVRRGDHYGTVLGKVRCITEELGGGFWVHFAAYRLDGSRVGYAKTRVGAASLLLPTVKLTPAVVTLTNPELWA